MDEMYKISIIENGEEKPLTTAGGLSIAYSYIVDELEKLQKSGEIIKFINAENSIENGAFKRVTYGSDTKYFLIYRV